jgi:hypothetical protein
MAEQGQPQVRWEYRILSDRGRMGRVTADDLTQVGEEGWELVMVMRDPTTVEPQINFYFKRRK